MCFKYAVLAYFILNGIIFAQSYSKSSADIKVRLINGAMFNIVRGNLDFNDLPKSFEGNMKTRGTEGIIVHFTGRNINNIMINYDNSEIHKINWEREKSDNIKASRDFLVFQPVIRRLNILGDENTFKIMSGSYFTFKEKRDEGLDLWIGGYLSNPSGSLDGTYSGKFAVNFIY